MLRMRILIIMVIALSLLPTACGGTGSVKLRDNDNGKSIEISKGGTLEITLVGNPTTGYLWQVVNGNDAVLKQNGDFTFKADSSRAGAPGKLTLRFEAAGTGTLALKLGYLRTFEQNVPPIQTFDVTVTVKQP